MPKKYLSASRLGTLEKCTWLYWCKYHLHLPDTPNEGMLRGSICHTIFELLLDPKKKKQYDLIIKAEHISGSKSVDKIVKSFMAKHPTFTKENYKENYELVDKMILLGLNHDFFGGEGAKIDCPEQEFRIENEDPKYNIYGFMDKPEKYEKEGLVKIVDYKSSKNKYRGEELTCNPQAMMYSLAAKKLWPKFKKVMVQFLFLKFPRSPAQELEYNEDQLKGFEYYLERVQKLIDDFDETIAKSNYAADNKYRWLCGPAKSGWECPVKKPFDFYVLLNEKGDVASSSFKDDFTPKKGQTVEKREYSGCPRHSFVLLTENNKSKQEDLFDF